MALSPAADPVFSCHSDIWDGGARWVGHWGLSQTSHLHFHPARGHPQSRPFHHVSTPHSWTTQPCAPKEVCPTLKGTPGHLVG